MTTAPKAAVRPTYRLGIACAVVAFLSCLAWAWVTPPFQAPDETVHFAYVQRLAETGTPPSPAEVTKSPWSSAQAAALRAIRFTTVRANPLGKPPWTAQDERLAEWELSRPFSQSDGGGADAASNYPPLYYSLEAVPYLAADAFRANVLNQLTLMRVVSVLLTSIAVLLIFLFLSELLPGRSLAAATGALTVGLLPYVAFIGSSVNNDVLLVTVCAALFWLLARSFRLGLSQPSAAGIGLLMAAGWMTKPSFAGIVPGVLLGLAVLCVRVSRASGAKPALKLLATFLVALLVPVIAYLAVRSVAWGGLSDPVASGVADQGSGAAGGSGGSLTGLLSYGWQYWLPRLPFLTDQVPEPYPLWETMFKGFVGRFGWLEFQFPSWVYWTSLGVVAALAALAARGLYEARSAIPARVGELSTYALMAAGVIATISVVGYNLRINGQSFEQARYLFPLLALLGGVIGVAMVAGRRAAPYLALALILMVGTLNIGGLILSVGRFYA